MSDVAEWVLAEADSVVKGVSVDGGDGNGGEEVDGDRG